MRKGGWRGFVAQYKSLVKSVQHVEVSIAAGNTTGTATLSTAVNTAKCIRFWRNRTFDSLDSQDKVQGTCLLTNSNTVTATINTLDSTHGIKFYMTIVELFPWAIQALEQGTINLTVGNLTTSKSIGFTCLPATDKNVVTFYLGNTTTSSGDSARINKGFAALNILIDNSGNITLFAHRGADTAPSMVVGYCVIKFTPGIIKSNQQLSLTQTGSSTTDIFTIGTSVVMANSFLVFGGFNYSDGFEGNQIMFWLSAVNQITLSRNAGGITGSVYLHLIELYPRWVVSVQRDRTTFTVDGATTNETITTVNAAKAFLTYCGDNSNIPFTLYGATVTAVKYADASTVQIIRGNGTSFGSNNNKESWEAINLR